MKMVPRITMYFPLFSQESCEVFPGNLLNSSQLMGALLAEKNAVVSFWQCKITECLFFFSYIASGLRTALRKNA